MHDALAAQAATQTQRTTQDLLRELVAEQRRNARMLHAAAWTGLGFLLGLLAILGWQHWHG